MPVEVIKKFLKNITGKFGALLVKCRKGRCAGIKVKILEQFMVDGSSLHGDLEVKERIERDFPAASKINPGTLAEIPTVLVHLSDFRQQDLFDFFRVGHSVPPLVKSKIIF